MDSPVLGLECHSCWGLERWTRGAKQHMSPYRSEAYCHTSELISFLRTAETLCAENMDRSNGARSHIQGPKSMLTACQRSSFENRLISIALSRDKGLLNYSPQFSLCGKRL
jgi:hypothetical protein